MKERNNFQSEFEQMSKFAYDISNFY